MDRPIFGDAWEAFQRVHVPVAEVGEIVGGKVKLNIDDGIFTNACPIRMSYVLNQTNCPIPASPYAASSGSDASWYLFRVRDMIALLKDKFGAANQAATQPLPEDFAGEQGILAFLGHGWSDATGHVTLWDGETCADQCHFVGSPDNGTFAPDIAMLWTLP